ncbi:MAG: mechanosensitive ion channel family protein [Christensenellaceae bacterium]|jgi:small conductance mechanosensitive channel|nr:mechanosensitive ion channel family protein [Christensenellaceae bacterium]
MRILLFIKPLDTLLETAGLGYVAVLVNILLAFLCARILIYLTAQALRKSGAFRIKLRKSDETAARRVETGVKILEGVSKYVFYFLALIVSISELGLGKAALSLLAAAGIGTLAVGIGAQHLIGDVAAGCFMLFEGQLSVGDYVLIGGIEGIVEEVTLRTVTVRGARGEKNIIPNGEVKIITNYSRADYMAIIELAVAHEADADRALDILYQEAAAEYETLRSEGVQPPQRVGIVEVKPSGVTLRVTMRADAMQQWAIAREVIRRARQRFMTEGIATPHDTLVIRGEQPC